MKIHYFIQVNIFQFYPASDGHVDEGADHPVEERASRRRRRCVLARCRSGVRSPGFDLRAPNRALDQPDRRGVIPQHLEQVAAKLNAGGTKREERIAVFLGHWPGCAV